MTDTRTSELDCVVHLGAGITAGLPGGVSLNASRYLLVEGDVSEAVELKRHLAHRQDVEVIDCFVAGESGPAVFHQCSFRELSSLAAPRGLERRFPGIRVDHKLEVEATGVADLLSQLEMDGDASIGLVIDTPGIEIELVRALKASGWLERLNEVVLFCDLEGVYEGAAGADDVLDELRSGTFAVVQEVHDHDPDRPCWRLEFDERRQELEEFRTTCRQLKADNDTLSAENAQLREQRSDLSERVRELSEKAEGLEDSNESVSERVRSLSRENEDLKAKRNELSSEVESLKADVKELDQKLREARLLLEQKESEQSMFDEVSEMRRLLQNQTANFHGMESRVSQSLTKGIADSARNFHAVSCLGRMLGEDFVSPRMIARLPGTEFALSVVEDVQTGRYDLVVQFGADALIPMLARAMHNHLQHIEYSSDGQEGNGERRRKELAISGTRRFLPTPILGFECNHGRWEEVVRSLEDCDLAELADVDYAPLVEDRDRDERPCLFFSCRRVLEGVADSVASPGRKVLVVVDLDRSMPEGFAWYPVLVHVLNALSSCEISLFVNGGGDTEREECVAGWGLLLDARSLPWEGAAAPGFGGAWRLQVNGSRRS